ncbi:tRNA uridine-5-carboxymethylaminomethyl(34) synthesis GTPase MnmE [Desulfoscipio gibsoniae]
MIDDTIAAIATPIGEGGIGIVRISGPRALEITQKVFRASKNKNWYRQNFKLVYGYIYDPGNSVIIDEVLVGLMRAPHSYTKEDVIEINCHGGALPLRNILELILKMGSRLAEPGEFTKRAFLNGRLDLIQAESIIDIIRANTDDAMRLAVGQLSGGLSQKINNIQQQLLEITALIEANIDFPEEDGVDEYDLKNIKQRVEQIENQIKKLLESAETGKVYREGVRTVIIGKPNVGKSSLLNVLIKENRAIVTDIPGTTRDLIEEIINIGGVPLKVIDTAGIRETEDVIEKIGVQKTVESINAADFVIMVFDAQDGISNTDNKIIEMIKNKRGIKVLNKIDIQDDNVAINKHLNGILPHWPLIEISALMKKGIEKLEKEIVLLITDGKAIPRDGVMVSNVRHKNQLVKAIHHLQDIQKAISRGVSIDLIAIDIRGAWEAVSEITGTAITENIIDKIFAEFCIGK